ncbi:MAG: hypothetical protein KF882_09765, partial [Bacteroidia bacterium]|nr:hypothetical protein [Bacteroidia bacterium]
MKRTILISVVIAMSTFTATTFINGTINSTQAETHLCESESYKCKYGVHNENEFDTDCREANNHELYMKIESRVTDTINGTHTVRFSVIVKDTVKFSAISLNAGSYFELTNFPLDTGVNYLPDSNSYQLTLSYNHTQIPAYFQEVRITLFSQNRRYDEFIYLYFDNDSLYTWSAFDFLSLDREWIIPHSHESIGFSLGETDTLSIPTFDTLLPYQYLQVPGKAYCVPVNVDTAGLDEGEYFRRSTKIFNGRITGNIRHLHRNDINQNVFINIVGIKIEIWEQRGGFVNPNKLIEFGFTNSNGEFDISYNHSKFTFNDNISIFVRVVNENSFLRVGASLRLPNIIHNHNNGNLQTFNLGNIDMPAASLAQVFHWSYRAISYAFIEAQGWNDISFTDNKINIFLNNEWSFYRHSENRIFLLTGHISNEMIVQHEIGHYLQFRVLQNGKRQTNSGGQHTVWHNNSHPNQTITEGFANAVAYITDARYFTDDQEANDVANLFSSNSVHERASVNNTTHNFTASELFARTLLDLFDDVNKFESFEIPVHLPHWRNFIEDSYDGSFPEMLDRANFSYKEIMRPFYQNRSSDANTIQDLGQYFKQLVVNTSDCEKRNHIKEMMDWNLVNIGNMVGFPERLSTDLIFVNQTINHRNDNLDENWQPGTPAFYNYTYHAIDRSELNSTIGSFNVTNNHNGWGTTLSDPLTITDEQTLYINNNVKSNWLSGSGSNPAQNSHVTMSFCNQLTTVEETGKIIIGDWTEYSTATAYIGSGTTIVLESGSELIINNNSKLVIEAGGRIDFHPGAKIVLNGDNAVLEIKGDIRLMP